MLLDQVGPAVQHLRALDRRARAPVLEGARGRANGTVRVLGPGLRDRPEDLAARGVDGLERLALGGRHALAVDQQVLDRAHDAD